VFWGTAWTSQTLLARERRAAEQAERRDGRRRVFVIDAQRVAQELPAYGEFVREQTARLGRGHPMIKTQFFGEEIDAEGGMFPPQRLALMQGQHPALEGPRPGRMYAMLVDVAGQEEGSLAAFGQTDGVGYVGQADGLDYREGAADRLDYRGQANSLSNMSRDSTALTLVEVDLETVGDPLIMAPRYHVVARRLWTGANQTVLYAQIRSLIETWQPKWVVIDATGVGAGLSSFLERAFPDRVLPFVFSQSSKSKLGWDFLGVVDSGRFKDYAAELGETGAAHAVSQASATARLSASLPARIGLSELFSRQAENCQYEVLPGPGKVLRWGVPQGLRDPQTGELLHDDLLVSAALVGALDGLQWAVSGPALIVPRPDPLDEMDREGY
jgi:hypothetical protein